MPATKEIWEFPRSIDREIVFHVIDVNRGSPVYGEAVALYERLTEEFFGIVRPHGAYSVLLCDESLEFIYPCELCGYGLYTLGQGITDKINECFNTGEYLSGMMFDAMADNYLEVLRKTVYGEVVSLFGERGFAASKPYEPFADISHLYQHKILENVRIGLTATEGYMLNPLKSGSFIAGSEPAKQAGESALTVRRGSSVVRVSAENGGNLLRELQKLDVFLSAACGGRGSCGKCGAYIDGEWTLCCQVTIGNDMEITIPDSEADGKGIKAVTAHGASGTEVAIPRFGVSRIKAKGGAGSLYKQVTEATGKRIGHAALRRLSAAADEKSLAGESEPLITVLCDESEALDASAGEMIPAYGIAIDIGTTTIALELYDVLSGDKIASYSMINGQRKFGADVLSRIKAASEGRLNELCASVRGDLKAGAAELCSRGGVEASSVRRAFISGNTTMLHLLMDINCRSLGLFPFTPAFVESVDFPGREVFGDALDCKTTLLPGISTYVGSDISAGVVCCGGDGKNLLIDLGTNGEMAYYYRESVLCTSTAAGPAFEGGNISCGMAAVPGAIAKAVWENGGFTVTAIDGKTPAGICGSGVLDIGAQLVKNALIDETGSIDESFPDEGVPVASEQGVFFTQKDVRELQLAKSAVRAGIEVLLDEAGVTFDEVDAVFLAGGFGYKADPASAEAIGLIPGKLVKKIIPVGNSSLGGCVKALLDVKAQGDIEGVCLRAREMNLSNDPRFNDLFMENMYFE